MITLDKLASDEQIRQEYQKTFLLNMFRKICVKMNNDESYQRKVRTLFLQSHNHSQTTQILVAKLFDYELSLEEACTMSVWFEAYLRKSNRRKPIPMSVKYDLHKRQQGRCMVCGEALGSDWSKIHIDHIIPWVLVGDELLDNYQALCDTCNQCKSSSTDYIFKNMIKLI